MGKVGEREAIHDQGGLLLVLVFRGSKLKRQTPENTR